MPCVNGMCMCMWGGVLQAELGIVLTWYRIRKTRGDREIILKLNKFSRIGAGSQSRSGNSQNCWGIPWAFHTSWEEGLSSCPLGLKGQGDPSEL